MHCPGYSWLCRAPLSSWITVKLVIRGRRSSKLLVNCATSERKRERIKERDREKERDRMWRMISRRREKWNKMTAKIKRANTDREEEEGGSGGLGGGAVCLLSTTQVWLAITPILPFPFLTCAGMGRLMEADGDGGGSGGCTRAENQNKEGLQAWTAWHVSLIVLQISPIVRELNGVWEEAHPAHARKTCSLHRLRKQLSRPAGLLHVTRGFDVQPLMWKLGLIRGGKNKHA